MICNVCQNSNSGHEIVIATGEQQAKAYFACFSCARRITDYIDLISKTHTKEPPNDETSAFRQEAMKAYAAMQETFAGTFAPTAPIAPEQPFFGVESIPVNVDYTEHVDYTKPANFMQAQSCTTDYSCPASSMQNQDWMTNRPVCPEPSSRFAFIVSSCPKYIPELCACLNSLDYIGNENDVYVLGYHLPPQFTSQFNKLNYKVHYYDIPEPEARRYSGESEILCRKRYWYAAEYGQNYEAMCVLDADMVFLAKTDQYHEIAAKTGFILGASLEQKRVYGQIEHHKIKGKQILSEPRWNSRDICCAPMFVDMRKHGDVFRECWTIFADGWPVDNFKAPDMESYNLLFLAKNMTDQVILLPNYGWVASNEKLLKPYTRITVQHGQFFTESGEPIFIIHGQFYKQRWRQVQLENRHGCAMGYLGCAEKCDNMAQGAMQCMWDQFRKMLDYKMVVDKLAYTGSGDPGTTLI